MHAIDTSEDLLKITKVSMSLKRASGQEDLVGMVVAKIIIDSLGDEFKSIDRGEGERSGAVGSGSGGLKGDAGASSTGRSKEGASGSGAGGSGKSKSSAISGEVDGEAVGGTKSSPELSQRFPMRGLKKAKYMPEDQSQSGPEVKPSVYEDIMKKIGK